MPVVLGIWFATGYAVWRYDAHHRILDVASQAVFEAAHMLPAAMVPAALSPPVPPPPPPETPLRRDSFSAYADEFDGRVLEDYCASRSWHEGVVFSCEVFPGGVGRVRNGLLTCVRMAIETGCKEPLPFIARS